MHVLDGLGWGVESGSCLTVIRDAQCLVSWIAVMLYLG